MFYTFSVGFMQAVFPKYKEGGRTLDKTEKNLCEKLFNLLFISLGFVPSVFWAGQIADGLYLTSDDKGVRLLEHYRDLKRDGVLFEYFDQGMWRNCFSTSGVI